MIKKKYIDEGKSKINPWWSIIQRFTNVTKAGMIFFFKRLRHFGYAYISDMDRGCLFWLSKGPTKEKLHLRFTCEKDAPRRNMTCHCRYFIGWIKKHTKWMLSRESKPTSSLRARFGLSRQEHTNRIHENNSRRIIEPPSTLIYGIHFIRGFVPHAQLPTALPRSMT